MPWHIWLSFITPYFWHLCLDICCQRESEHLRRCGAAQQHSCIKQEAASMQLRPEPFSTDSVVQWVQVREKKGKVGLLMAPIIKWQPHCHSAFQKSLKPGVTDFQPLMRGLLPPAKCVVLKICRRLRGCRHHATLGRQMIFHNSFLHMQDHSHTLCSPFPLPASLPPCASSPKCSVILPIPHPLSHVFFPPPVHMHMCNLIPRHPFTHLHFLLHPHSLWYCFPYDAQQCLPTHPAGTLSCSSGSHVLCLWIPYAVVKLLLVQFSHVCVLSDTHLQSSGPEQDQHVSG